VTVSLTGVREEPDRRNILVCVILTCLKELRRQQETRAENAKLAEREQRRVNSNLRAILEEAQQLACNEPCLSTTFVQWLMKTVAPDRQAQINLLTSDTKRWFSRHILQEKKEGVEQRTERR
jgi:hypothetical protein